MLIALSAFHSTDTSRFVLGLASLFVIVNGVSSFQIYGMPMFDILESLYVRRKKQPCSWWLRALIRAVYGFFIFFMAVAIPFLASLAGLTGGLALPVTLAFPCFMWLKVKKPKAYGPIWCIHWALGVLGIILSVLVTAAAIYLIADTGIKLNFFDPQ